MSGRHLDDAHLDEDCIFCKIIRAEIPCFKVLEDDEIDRKSVV